MPEVIHNVTHREKCGISQTVWPAYCSLKSSILRTKRRCLEGAFRSLKAHRLDVLVGMSWDQINHRF